MTATGVLDADFSSLPARRVDDPSTPAGSTRFYGVPSGLEPAPGEPWTLAARVRVRDLADAADLGVELDVAQAVGAARRFLVMLGSDADADLIVLLSNGAGPPASYTLPSIGSFNTDHAVLELASDGFGNADLFVNGVLAVGGFTGSEDPAVTSPRVFWGAGSSAQTGEGYWAGVRYATGLQACRNGIDDDGDGLSDGHELTLELDPIAPDADGDGLADGFEAAGAVFVTVSEHTGALGGLAGGDAICVAESAALELPRASQARAWLSTPAENARDRIAPGAYRSVHSGEAFWSSLPGTRAIVPLSAVAPGIATKAWTGAGFTGTTTAADCNGWSLSSLVAGTVGRASAPNGLWTNDGLFPPHCNSLHPLYCFVPALGTDPALADTDGDGLATDEIDAGTDPLDPGSPAVIPAAPPLALGALAALLALAARQFSSSRP